MSDGAGPLQRSRPLTSGIGASPRPFKRTVTMHKDSSGHVGFVYKSGKISALVKDSSAARNGLLSEHYLCEVNGQNVIGLKVSARLRPRRPGSLTSSLLSDPLGPPDQGHPGHLAQHHDRHHHAQVHLRAHDQEVRGAGLRGGPRAPPPLTSPLPPCQDVERPAALRHGPLRPRGLRVPGSRGAALVAPRPCAFPRPRSLTFFYSLLSVFF